METQLSIFQSAAAMRRMLATFIGLALCLSIIGCGGSSTSTPTLSSLAVTPANKSIMMGNTQQMSATATYSNGSTADLTGSVTWSSSAAGVATVSSGGLATSVATGSTTVSASSGGVSANTALTVTPALISIDVTPATPSIPVNGTQQFTATGTYSDASQVYLTGSATWSSSATGVAAVNSAGLGTGVAAGTANITATSGSITGSTALTVTPILVSLAVTVADPVIDINTTTQFTATGTLSDGSSQDFTQLVNWASPGGIASIDGNGVATGVSVGTTQPTVTASSGSINSSLGLQVTSPTLVFILISNDGSSVPLGINRSFTATGVFSNGDAQDLASAVWNSSDPTKVSIDISGSAQTFATGTVSISATYGSVTSTATFTVLPATLVSIGFSPSAPSIALGTTVRLTAVGTFTDGSTQDLSPVCWNSDDPSVAYIQVNGTVLASGNAIGTANISATSGSITGSTLLTVTSAVVASIAVLPASATIPAGTTQQFTATGTFTDSTTQDLTTVATWTSSDGTIANISNTGLAGAVAVGSSTMTASVGSISGSGTLNVGPATLQSITITPQDATIGKGTTLQFTATGNYSDSSTQDLTALVTWTTSDSTLVSITSAGLATARQFGTATITATLGSVTDSTTLIVNKNPLQSIVVTPVTPSPSPSDKRSSSQRPARTQTTVPRT